MSGGGYRVRAEPPYYAVIFTSVRSPADEEGYAQMSARMVELAARVDGFLGMDSAREDVGITISYWRDLESIRAWKRDAEHMIAQGQGRRKWYDSYRLRVALVERDYEFDRGESNFG